MSEQISHNPDDLTEWGSDVRYASSNLQESEIILLKRKIVELSQQLTDVKAENAELVPFKTSINWLEDNADEYYLKYSGGAWYLFEDRTRQSKVGTNSICEVVILQIASQPDKQK